MISSAKAATNTTHSLTHSLAVFRQVLQTRSRLPDNDIPNYSGPLILHLIDLSFANLSSYIPTRFPKVFLSSFYPQSRWRSIVTAHPLRPETSHDWTIEVSPAIDTNRRLQLPSQVLFIRFVLFSTLTPFIITAFLFRPFTITSRPHLSWPKYRRQIRSPVLRMSCKAIVFNGSIDPSCI